MLAGSIVVSHITSPLATWSALLILLSIHLWTNYKAVRAVSMRTLNRQRANIIFSSYIQSLRAGEPFSVRELKAVPYGDQQKRFDLPAPDEVAIKERIFEFDGVLRWHSDVIMGHCAIGVPLKDILKNFPYYMRNPKTGSYSSIKPIAKDKAIIKDVEEEDEEEVTIEELLKIFRDEKYILWYSLGQSRSAKSQRPHFMIVLKETSGPNDHLKGWFHAFLCARRMYEDPKHRRSSRIALLKWTLEEVKECWREIYQVLLERDWDMETGALETRPGVRVGLEPENKRRR